MPSNEPIYPTFIREMIDLLRTERSILKPDSRSRIFAAVNFILVKGYFVRPIASTVQADLGWPCPRQFDEHFRGYINMYGVRLDATVLADQSHYYLLMMCPDSELSYTVVDISPTFSPLFESSGAQEAAVNQESMMSPDEVTLCLHTGLMLDWDTTIGGVLTKIKTSGFFPKHDFSTALITFTPPKTVRKRKATPESQKKSSNTSSSRRGKGVSARSSSPAGPSQAVTQEPDLLSTFWEHAPTEANEKSRLLNFIVRLIRDRRMCPLIPENRSPWPVDANYDGEIVTFRYGLKHYSISLLGFKNDFYLTIRNELNKLLTVKKMRKQFAPTSEEMYNDLNLFRFQCIALWVCNMFMKILDKDSKSRSSSTKTSSNSSLNYSYL